MISTERAQLWRLQSLPKRGNVQSLSRPVLTAGILMPPQDGVLKATDLGDRKLANLVRYHCEQPPASEQVCWPDAVRLLCGASLGPRNILAMRAIRV